MAVELNQLRDQIDEVDKQMVELLARVWRWWSRSGK